MRSFDELTTEEKQKFTVYNLWLNNRLVLSTWIFAVLLVLMPVSIIFNVTNVHIFYQAYILMAMIVFLVLLIVFIKKMKKEQHLIFGIVDSVNKDFFGITDKHTKVTFRELVRDFEKMQIKGREKKEV